MKPIQFILVISILLTGCTGVPPKLGVENGQLTPCPDSPNCVSSQADDKEHFIDPIMATGSPAEVKSRLLKVIDEFSRAEVVEAEGDYIRAEFTSLVFRFVDDVEFYFPDTGKAEMAIHVRSASRIGQSDFGVNRKRIEQIRSKFGSMSKKK